MRSDRQIVSYTMTSSGVSTLYLATNSTVYTNTFDVSDAEYFAVSCKVTAAATASANVNIVLEQGHNPPTAQASADVTYVTPVGCPNIISNLGSTNAIDTWFHQSFSPLPMRWARFKLSGVAWNTASTVSIIISKMIEG